MVRGGCMLMNMRLTKRGILALSTILVLSVLYFILFATDLLNVTTVKLNEGIFLDKKEILKIVDLTKKKPCFLVNTNKMENNLLKHPYVRGVKVTKDFPHDLEINIDYREDFMSIKETGFYVIIDEDLNVLRIDETYYDAYFVEGFYYKDFAIGSEINIEHKDVLKNTVSLIKLMKKSHIQFMKKISYSDGNIYIYINDNFRGRFGDVQDVETKFNEFVNIYENLSQKRVKSGMVDVSTKGQPIYKPFID
jgi:cell division protein FtsQ